MLLDARNADEVPNRIEATTVIIGGGAVGLYTAVALARARIPVLVCEAAGHVADTSRNELTAVSIGKNHDGVKLGRAFGLGGTTTLWGGQLAEFEPDDIADRSAWPIEFRELEQWYSEVYEFLAVHNRQPVAAYRLRFGGENHSEEDVERFFTFWLPQPNFPVLFRKDIVANTYLKILLNAPAATIAFDDTLASKVGLRCANGRRIEVVAKRFVFAMGTIENSRFFLSQQRMSPVPWRDNKLVGCYFQDHLDGRVATAAVIDERRFRNFFENGFVAGLKLQPKLRFAPRLRKSTLNGVCGAFAFDSTISEELGQLKSLLKSLKTGLAFSSIAALPANILQLSHSMLPLVARYVRSRRIMAFFDRGLTFRVQSEQIPNRDSRIMLLDGPPGPDGLFRAGVDWKIDGREIVSIKRFTQRANAYLQKWGIARLDIDDDLSRDDPVVLTRLSDTYHQCGGLRMAAHASDGVVDSDCRVWGTRNVYVAGASVFPTSSHANCTLTALAVAARLVALLKA